MSAVNRADTVAQLAQALRGPHPVVVHHDFSQQPQFDIDPALATFVPDPVRTGWGVYAFSEGIFRLLRFCLEQYDFDYFQLLSPTCLPIKPVDAFAEYVGRSGLDANFDYTTLATDPMAKVSQAYRVYARRGSLRYRLLWRARGWCIGASGFACENRQGLSFPADFVRTASGRLTPKARLGAGLVELAHRGIGFSHPFSDAYPARIGATWFGASRKVCEFLLDMDRKTPLPAFCRDLSDPDEFMFPTAMVNAGFRVGPSNHWVNDFEEARPKWFGDADFARLLASPRFFARKFPDDPTAPIRHQVIRHVAGIQEPSVVG